MLVEYRGTQTGESKRRERSWNFVELIDEFVDPEFSASTIFRFTLDLDSRLKTFWTRVGHSGIQRFEDGIFDLWMLFQYPGIPRLKERIVHL